MLKKIICVCIFFVLCVYTIIGLCEEPVNTPAVATPTVDTPAVATPIVDTPTVATPTVDTPAVATPIVDTPTVATDLNSSAEAAHKIYKSKIEDEKIGLVEGITANEIIINLGKDLYVTPSMEFKVFRKEKRIELPEKRTSILIGEYYIATIKVIDVEKNKSRCKVIHREPTDNIMATDKVVSIPGTGYEEIIKQRQTENKASQKLYNAKKVSRTNKDTAIELYNSILKDFPGTTSAALAQEALDRYKRIADNTVYEFKGIRRFCADKNDIISFSKDISVDSNGSIWLLNSKRVLLEKYSKSGELIIAIEKKNKFNREIMRTPTNITIDKDDNIYVLDTGLKKVSKFDSEGNFINDYGPKDSQQALVKPIDLAVNSNQDVFILDAGTANVIAFNKDTDFWAVFGKFNIPNGKEPELIAIDTDESDNIYVFDMGTKYLHTFSKDLRKTKRELLAQISIPVDIVVSINRAYILDAEKCSVIEFNLASGEIVKNYAAKGNTQGSIDDPAGFCIDTESNVYIADGKNFSFQKFSPEAKFLFKFKDSQISNTESFTINDSNNIYVLNSSKGEYQEFDEYGKSLSQVFLKTEFKSLTKIVNDFEGNVYILDAKDYKIHKFSPDGKLINSFGSKSMFQSPVDICIDINLNIYVLDDREYKIIKFDPSGNSLISFGQRLIKKRKETTGQFKKPAHIAIDNKGTLFVLDEKLKEVFKFNSETGDLISSFKKPENDFISVADIAIDGLNYIYIADSRENNVYKFKNDGSLVTTININNLSNLKIKSIFSISVDGIGNLYVLDNIGDKVIECNQ